MSDREALAALLEADTAPASFGYALFEKRMRGSATKIATTTWPGSLPTMESG